MWWSDPLALREVDGDKCIQRVGGVLRETKGCYTLYSGPRVGKFSNVKTSIFSNEYLRTY